jgi:hypothetical protein
VNKEFLDSWHAAAVAAALAARGGGRGGPGRSIKNILRNCAMTVTVVVPICAHDPTQDLDDGAATTEPVQGVDKHPAPNWTIPNQSRYQPLSFANNPQAQIAIINDLADGGPVTVGTLIGVLGVATARQWMQALMVSIIGGEG